MEAPHPSAGGGEAAADPGRWRGLPGVGPSSDPTAGATLEGAAPAPAPAPPRREAEDALAADALTDDETAAD